jgi:DNA-directed RNA polymerase subunit M/transcription elongation factor TFIIS
MVEFCEKCDGMMLPSKDQINPSLVFNSWGHIKPLKREVIPSYKSTRRRTQKS